MAGLLWLTSARAQHATRHTYSDMHTLHAIHFAAYLRPTFYPTEYADAVDSRCCIAGPARMSSAASSSPSRAIDMTELPIGMTLTLHDFFVITGRLVRERLRSPTVGMGS